MASESVLIAVLIGTLAAIVYTLRMIVAMDKKLDMLLQNKGLK